MANSPILNIPEVATSQDQKEIVINDAIEALEASTNSALIVSIASGNVTLTQAQFVGNFVIRAQGASVARTITVPDTVRFFVIRNEGTGPITVTNTVGASVTVNSDTSSLLMSVVASGIFVLATNDPAAILGPIPNNTVLGNISGSSAVPGAVTEAQLTVLINAFTSSLSGAVPAYGTADASAVLRANGTWTDITASDVNTAVSATYGVPTLDSTGKVATSYIPTAILDGMHYLGGWNASTNSPTLASGTGTAGSYYTVSTAGTTTLDGINDWQVNDHAAFNGTAWERFDGAANQWRAGVVTSTDSSLLNTSGVLSAVQQLTIESSGTVEAAHTLNFDSSFTVALASGVLTITAAGGGGTGLTPIPSGTILGNDSGVSATPTSVVVMNGLTLNYVPNTEWNPAISYPTHIVYSDGDLAAQVTGGGGVPYVILGTPLVPNKGFFVIKDNATYNYDNTRYGVAAPTANTTLDLGSDTLSVGVVVSHGAGPGNIYSGGSVVYGSYPSIYRTGLPTGIAYDKTAKLVWFTKDGTTWYGTTNTADPVAGTYGIDISALLTASGGVLLPAMSAVSSISDGYGLIDPTAAGLTAPTGFTTIGITTSAGLAPIAAGTYLANTGTLSAVPVATAIPAAMTIESNGTVESINTLNFSTGTTLTVTGSVGVVTASGGGGGGGGGSGGGGPSLYATGLRTPIASDFSWINQGGATAANATFGPMTLIAPQDSSTEVRFYGESVPGSPWTGTSQVTMGMASSSYHYAGVAVTDGTKFSIFVFLDNGSVPYLSIQRWNTYSSYGSTPFSIPIQILSPSIFFRINDDGTNVNYQYSIDGSTNSWVTVYSEARTDYLTATEYGYALNAENGSNGPAVMDVWQHEVISGPGTVLTFSTGGQISYDRPALSHFTWYNQGVAVATDIPNGPLVVAVSGDSGAAFHGLGVAFPSADFVAIGRIGLQGTNDGTNGPLGGLFISDTSGKIVSFAMQYNDSSQSNNDQTINIVEWSGPSSYNNTIFKKLSGIRNPMYFRLTYTHSTNIVAYATSLDGVYYSPATTYNVTSFLGTLSLVGFAEIFNNTGSDEGAILLYDWSGP